MKIPAPALLALLALSFGCEDAAPSVLPRFDPTLATGPSEADTWLSFPFPSDHRRTADGHARFDDFPNPRRIAQLDEWTAEAQATLDGFSVMGAAYFAFDGAIDESAIPTTPEAFLSDESPIWIVDVTEGAAEFGKRFPCRSSYYPLPDVTSAKYVVPNTLAIAPAWGFPLLESHTYAVVVRASLPAGDGSDIGQPSLVRALLTNRASAPRTTPRVDAALYETLRSKWSGLRAYLANEGLDDSDVVVATVYTTQSLTRDLGAIADQIAAAPTAPVMTGGFDPQAGALAYTTSSFQWNSTESVDYAVYRGRYVAPNYQEGTIPFSESGGALHFVDGVPVKVSDESIDFVLTVPDALPDGARGCYPIVLYGHGTGGSRNSFRNDGTAGRLAARGIAGISIDMPLHGVRAQGMMLSEEFLTFNFTNAQAFRSNFRQGAVDLVSLARFVRESLAVSMTDSHTGQAIAFCDDHVGYMGHSQGGLTGALALPFLTDVDSFVLSGAGGAMGITIMERKDILDFEALLAVLFQIPEEESWDEQHPLETLVQTLADVSDPAAYAPYWGTTGAFRPTANVMLTNGEHDEATPYRGAIALALSAGLPVTTPVVIPIPEYAILGLAPAMPTYQGNVTGRTTGFLQFTDDLAIADADTHYLVFHRPEAIDATMHFLATGTSTNGVAVMRRDASADAR